mmetsp:Transcript_76414/g.224180  ORF Transcript_76414/g.224180 Transcript_76414/m.224180 type:complete len:907 (+) Transcript_76414:69-2789(+)
MESSAADSADQAEPNTDANASLGPREPTSRRIQEALATKELRETAHHSSLDETITDPLKEVEREVLTKIRKHEEAVGSLRFDVAALRDRETGNTSIAELRSITGEADRLERLLKLPREILARESLAQFEWPAADLAEARAVLAKVDACETATRNARKQIAENNSSDCNPQSLSEALQQLVSSWYMLRSAERSARSGTTLAVKRVDLNVEAQAVTVGPLCDALLDKAVEVYASLSLKARANNSDPESTISVNDGIGLAVFTERLRAFVQIDWVVEALQALRVEVPNHDLFQAPRAGDAGTATEPSVQCEDAERDRTQLLAASGTEMVGSPGEPEIMDAASPAPPPQAQGSAAGGADATATAALPTPTRAPDAEDPLLQTVPCLVGSWAGGGVDETGVVGSGAIPSPQVTAAGSAELWHAVHIGDQATVEAMINKDFCNATMRDASGHSVMWHAVAFNHVGLANLMLDAFPPGTERGVEVAEIHPRKGDTLLHLLCQSKTFGTQLAHLFKRVAAASPPTLFQKVNRAGLTFFQIAASSLNFWVLTFVLRNFHAQAKALVCMPNNAPMRNVAEVIAQPLPPEFSHPIPFPEHFRVAELLQQDELGTVPYADVAFDVGPDNAEVAAGRFLAHRIVVATQSPVLFEALEKLPLTELPKEGARVAIFRVDPRISQEVWRSALQFMYTGVINCTYARSVDKVVELLRACTMYKLPKPLIDFAQSCLYPLLPASPPHIALQAFSICAGSAAADTDLRPIREASAYIILRSAHRLFESMEPKETTQILERVVQTVEQSVFNPRKVSGGTQAPVAQEAGVQVQARQAGPDTLTQSLRTMPRDTLLQSGRDLPQHDPMSQSLHGVWRQESQGPCGYPHMGHAPGAQAYGRVPGTAPLHSGGPLGSMHLGPPDAMGWR